MKSLRVPRLIATALIACALGTVAPIGRPAARAEDGQWPMAGKDYANTRFSGLSDIDANNVRGLALAFTFSTGVSRGHEAAPLVVGTTMYIATPYPNTVYALDLAKRGAPLKWRFEPNAGAAARAIACCDLASRGLAYSEGRLFLNTLDAQTIALDVRNGRELWRTRVGNAARGETVTMAPLVVKNLVLVGNSGDEPGVRGWLKALDAASGRLVWRAWSTGPDEDVLIGPEFHPHYAVDRGADLGMKTWPGEAWKIGGGNVWGWISYDPKLDLLYHGTGNPNPWNPEQRPGANKWTAGVFARRPATGDAVWFYQWSPHDLHVYDGVNENVLVDLPIEGGVRPVLLHPDRNGYLYVLDRRTGRVLSADPYVKVTTSQGVDRATGVLKNNIGKGQKSGQGARDVCPAAPGAKHWQPSAWSPLTGWLYIPHQNLCQDAARSQASYIVGTPYMGAEYRVKSGPGGHRGEFTAWDPVARRKVWSVKEPFPVWSGALATAGNVVFYGTMDGWFKAIDAVSGHLLWRFRTESGIVGQPVTYRGPDDKQYVAVLSGIGGGAEAVVSGALDPQDPAASAGFVPAARDLPATAKGGRLYVFALP